MDALMHARHAPSRQHVLIPYYFIYTKITKRTHHNMPNSKTYKHKWIITEANKQAKP